MKSFLLVASFLLAAQASAGVPTPQPIEVEAQIEKIFIPVGFDDNDDVEVVLHGNFPTTCYQVGRASAQVDAASHTVSLTATSFKYPGTFCLETITPFILPVKLGMLPEGRYHVAWSKDPKVGNDLTVTHRKTESPDDFLYATVENAYIDVNFETGKQLLKLQGHYPFFFIGCMTLQDVKIQRSPEVVVVQPIAQIVDDSNCADQPSDRSFEYTSGLTEPFHGEGLLHIRTLDGNSLNRYLNIQ